jgi:hypothetical protein
MTKYNCTENDYFFVPIVLLKDSDFQINLASRMEWIQSIENSVIEKFLEFESPIYKNNIYNTKASGRFEKGNPGGGFIEINTSPIAEIDGNLAWDSVSAAAADFQCDRKSIRNKLGKKFKRISLDEYKNWPDQYKKSNPKRLRR